VPAEPEISQPRFVILADVLQLVGDAASIVRSAAAARTAAASATRTTTFSAGTRPGTADRHRLNESGRKLVESRDVQSEHAPHEEIDPALDARVFLR
jgi:hypothetical protein